MTELCTCGVFIQWYTSMEHPGTVREHLVRWCHCGHEDSEHLDRKGSCTGEVERS